MKLLQRQRFKRMTVELTEGKINTIMYQKDGGVPEQRMVVPSFIPQQVVTVIDVGGMDTQAAEEVVGLMKGYQEYRTNLMNTAFNFETWVEHTQNKTITPKWRAFKWANILSVIG
jgi:hypothetical protein